MIGVSFDTIEDNAAFKSKFDFPFPLLSDTDKSLGQTYFATRPPDDDYADYPRRISYLINPEGKIANTYEVSDPAGHAEEVLAALLH